MQQKLIDFIIGVCTPTNYRHSPLSANAAVDGYSDLSNGQRLLSFANKKSKNHYHRSNSNKYATDQRFCCELLM